MRFGDSAWRAGRELLGVTPPFPEAARAVRVLSDGFCNSVMEKGTGRKPCTGCRRRACPWLVAWDGTREFLRSPASAELLPECSGLAAECCLCPCWVCFST